MKHGFYYYGARYYDPKVSLWLSVDPLSGYNPVFETEHYIDGEHNGGVFNSGNLNPYGYCYQNPILYVDPNGKQVDVVNVKRLESYPLKSKIPEASFSSNPNFQSFSIDQTKYIKNIPFKFVLGVGAENTVVVGGALEQVKNARSVKSMQTQLVKQAFSDGKFEKGEIQGAWYDIGKIEGKQTSSSISLFSRKLFR